MTSEMLYDRVDFPVILRLSPVFLAAFSGPLFGSGYLTIFGFVQDDFGISLFLIGLSISFYAVPFTLGQLFAAGLADLTSRKKMLKIGALLFGMGNIIDALSPSYVLFLLGRVIQGASVAILMPVVMSTLADSVVDEIRGKMMGLYGTTTALGVFLGPMVAGTIQDMIGWRFYFLLASLYGFLELLFLYFSHIRETHVFVDGNIWDKLRLSAKDTIQVGRSGSMLVVSFLGFLGFMYLIALISYTSKGLQLLRVSSNQIGFVISAFGLAGILFTSPGGWTADRIGRRNASFLGAVGLVIVAVVASLYLKASRLPSAIIIAILMFLFGLFISFYWAGLNTLATEVIPKKRGAATSFYSFFRNVGQVVAPILFEPIFRSGGLFHLYIAGIIIFIIAVILMLLSLKYTTDVAS